LRACLAALTQRTAALLAESRQLPEQVVDTRLALEISIIQAYADRLIGLLARRDPLSERVHLGKAGFVLFGARALMVGLGRRVLGGRVGARKPQDA
jgi:hypothetical protein